MLYQLILVFSANIFSPKTMDEKIHLKHDEINQVVHIYCGEELFTSYRYDSTQEKPVLYPLIASDGQRVTRKYPLEYSVGERVDHPHHVGMWLNYGDVNGLDFWNNSTEKSKDDPTKYGWIKHDDILEMSDGQIGTLVVCARWEDHLGTVLLLEETAYTFSSNQDTRQIIRQTTLKALDQEVRFEDNKEGMFGIRVARALELPSDKAVLLSGPDGKPATEKVITNEGVTGHYLSSAGLKGGDVWGTRAEWMMLHGQVEGHQTSIVIADHPENPGFPTYWHARGYGLFAANPLGQAVFSKGKEQMNFSLKPNAKAIFRHLVLVHSGSQLTAVEIDQRTTDFK